MEVSGKDLQKLLLDFLTYSGALNAFHGNEKQQINDFIENYYPALWNEKMRNS